MAVTENCVEALPCVVNFDELTVVAERLSLTYDKMEMVPVFFDGDYKMSIKAG